MSADNGTSGENRTVDADNRLSENVVASMSVQERDGTLQISLPKEGATALGIEKGDDVLVGGTAGDRALTVKKPCGSVFGNE